jgi:Ca2+:H+ antiporter
MKVLYWFLVLAPVAIVAERMHASPTVIFTLSALAIIPLSGLLGSATEELAGHPGPAIGGLLNATLGNLAELIIAGLALRAGLVDLVKASITGSILGNLLLVLGAAQLAGGLRHRAQTFNANYAGMSVSLLTIAVTGLVIPSVFSWLHPDPARSALVPMSEWTAALLIIGYVLSLVYSMGTHRAVFGEGGDVAVGEQAPHWSLGK